MNAATHIAACFVVATALPLAAEVSLLSASPGEDSSTEMRISWHSDSPSCNLRYGCVPGPLASARFEATSSPVEYTGKTNYYLCRAELKGLRPGTKYGYQVGGEADGPVHSFRTAGKGGSFNFLWMGDVHSTPNRHGKMKSVDALLADAEGATAKRGGLGFVLFSGDAVKHGQTYSCWKEWDSCRLAADYMVAAVPGNKEYYRDEGKTRWHNRWFVNARNNPRNGAQGLESTYWFVYDGVLFVGLDTLACEGREMDEPVRKSAQRLQEEWFEKVVSSQKGRFRFLVVFQHYPFFKKDGPCDYGRYESWRGLFDRHGVDFALSGDSHSYVRSRQLRGGAESDEGTVYVVCPEIDSHMEGPAIKRGEGLVAAFDSHSSSYGACWFSVGRDAMTMHYISGGAEDRDAATVKAKRRR